MRSYLLALISIRPGQKCGMWSQIIQTTQGALGSSNQTLKKKIKKPQIWSNHMQVTMSQVLLVLFSPFIFQVSRLSLVNPFARVCSQHICTVVCTLTHKLCGTHSISLAHTHTHMHTDTHTSPGAYVISSMHMIPQKHTYTLNNQTVTLGWQPPGVATKDHDTQRHFVTYCADAVCCCQPASQPASPQMPLT